MQNVFMMVNKNSEGPEKYNNTEVSETRGNFLQLPQGTCHLLL
jgi:hypothetical protein